jgi:hypothetical protein
MANPVPRSEAQAAQKQKAEDNPNLRCRAKRYLSVVPALLVVVGALLFLFDFRLIIVKDSAH